MKTRESIQVRTNVHAGSEFCEAWDTNCKAVHPNYDLLLDKNENPVFRNCNAGYPMAGEVCWAAIALAGYDILKYEGACIKC